MMLTVSFMIISALSAGSVKKTAAAAPIRHLATQKDIAAVSLPADRLSTVIRPDRRSVSHSLAMLTEESAEMAARHVKAAETVTDHIRIAAAKIDGSSARNRISAG